jgi:hypothetical protein
MRYVHVHFMPIIVVAAIALAVLSRSGFNQCHEYKHSNLSLVLKISWVY